MWGGIECTINRVGDAFFTQLDRSGHLGRDGDLGRFAALGIAALRYPVLWEATAPDGVAAADWSWTDRRLAELRRLGITPIVGLIHHGSGPRHTNLLDPSFAVGLAEFAGAVAARYPWVDHWTPVNEPLTTARFSALYGLWYPHARDDRSFVAALFNQCRATVLAMASIRRVNPAAQLIQTDDLGCTYGTEPLADVVDFYNERRWLGWDLLCGRVDAEHPLWTYLRESGATADEILWFAAHPCPPDVIGINYYVTSERWLDHRLDRYPGRCPREPRAEDFVDIESVRVLATPAPAIASLLDEAWQRYRIPLAVTEAHIDARREDQLRWLLEIWRAAEAARAGGADVRAVTAWSLLGSFDWNSLLAECRGYYEPGPFDVRAPEPRRTALAGLIAELAAGRTPSHPVLGGDGWWRRADRFLTRPVAPRSRVTPLSGYRPHVPYREGRAHSHQWRHGNAGPCLRCDLRQAQPFLPRARPPSPGHRQFGLGGRGDRALAALGDRQRERLRAHRRCRVRYRPLHARERDRARGARGAVCRGRHPSAHVLERPGLRWPRPAALGRERYADAAQRLRPQQGRGRA